ncbi:MAG: QueT transporter family protein [Clostridia bacterium]|nr:QueT transporter family protein [Clostridia bacterium]
MRKLTGGEWVRHITLAALTAALYIFLTVGIVPALSYQASQVRFGEALTVLPALYPAAIPGLIVGCLISNIILPVTALDVLFGTLATGLAALCTYWLRRRKFIMPLPPVVFNAVIVGAVIAATTAGANFLPTMLSVGAGQAVACYALGLPLFEGLRRLPMFKKKDETKAVTKRKLR